ncbi:hypothetical protein FRC19_008383 [Serendipita sp. 401]|nr:hypothetical protein FRC15_006256 [Serendipita sp. 397]KAG8783889.1 hypothetical protein FRC16_002280 [Serendipita sp. 398]KAG8828267.1 hypothetical protein FRC19_008383 [Serendipita sp. 401]KAG8847325.1 hypothetical protein FRC20_002775 [Serendipita sp. 405]KAG9058761.1 hypothetical protein FS842_003550 [Serendipita sp. 407]
MSAPPKASTSKLTGISDSLITYPSEVEAALVVEATPTTAAQVSKIQSKERLYVGNLHPTVDEHTLIQLFSRYGKLSKLDFLFHKSGPMKGKPRGYAFVEYADAEGAEKAVNACNQKLLRGRKLSVTYANQNADSSTSRHRPNDTKTTTLSLLKTPNRPKGTENKIAAMEAKLRQLEREKELKAYGEDQQELGGEASLPARPAHLPSRPPAAS